MTKLTPEQLRKLYLKLPEDLRDAMFSVDSADVIQNIGKKYKLTIDKIGEIADETEMMMLGLTHSRDFISNLYQRLETDKETVKKIAEEINVQIFAKVRESLKKVHSEDSKENETKETKEELQILEILKGTTNPFEAKTKEEVFRIPPEEKKYPGGDPYRESIE